MLDAAVNEHQILHASSFAAPEELLKYYSGTRQHRAEPQPDRGRSGR